MGIEQLAAVSRGVLFSRQRLMDIALSILLVYGFCALLVSLVVEGLLCCVEEGVHRSVVRLGSL